jgi:predicted secreted protein
MSRKLWSGLIAVFVFVFLLQMIFNIRRHALEHGQPQVPEIVVDMATLNETILADELDAKRNERLRLESPKPIQKSTQAQPSSDLPKDARQIQQALKAAGFDPGAIDGKLGSKTKAAIRSFQKAHELKIDGTVGRNTWRLLRRYLKD